MKGLYVLLSFALLAIPVHAQGISSSEEPIDLEALYQQIDDAISLSPESAITMPGCTFMENWRHTPSVRTYASVISISRICIVIQS